MSKVDANIISDITKVILNWINMKFYIQFLDYKMD